jgi:hypothetical protein
MRAKLATLSEDIADMVHTAVRIGERDGWDSELYQAISADIARWKQVRRQLARRTRQQEKEVR